MMSLKTVGIVIASRDLTLDGGQKVEVLVGKPAPCPDGVDWYCPHQTLGIGSGRVRYAVGVDSVQALILGLSMVGAELYASEEYEAGRLSWDGGARNADLGFPVPPTAENGGPLNQNRNGNDQQPKR